MVALIAIGMQVVLAVEVAASPVRFGVPLPAAAVAEGLRLRGPGKLQWRRLPIGGAKADPVWIEIALDSVRGTVRIHRGGEAASPTGSGAAVVRETSERRLPHGVLRVTRWAWSSGPIDERACLEFHAQTLLDGELYEAGEVRTRWQCGGERGFTRSEAIVRGVSRRVWQQAGLLPPSGRGGKSVRRRLLAVQQRLVEMPGERGAGDFLRSGDVVTNGEFDTALGLLRLALATGNRDAFARGVRCAQHLRDHDLDARTGLPFPHGSDHRVGTPQPGHAWLHGLLLAGLLTADDDLILTARSLGRALVAHPPMGEGHNERARDYAWPLLELEALLAWDADPLLAAAAARLARSIDARFDARHRTYRFGEGEREDGVYFERAWLTGGLVLPAMRQHLLRSPDRAMSQRLRKVQDGLLQLLGSARAGMPTHWRCAGGRTFAEHRVEHDVRALFMLEGLPPKERRQLLQRSEIKDCIKEVPTFDDPDLPTSFSLLARCRWIY